MSRGVQGVNLNTGQHFDEEIVELEQIVGTEIEWELGEAIPRIRHALKLRRGGRDDEHASRAGRLASMQSVEIDVDTSSATVVDLTEIVERFCRDKGDGLVNVFVPHATAGLALMETGSGSEADLVDALGRLFPRDGRYRHAHGSAGHGADHVLPAIVSPSLVLPVLGGRVALGTWQSVVLVDLNADNPRRRVRLSFVRAHDGD